MAGAGQQAGAGKAGYGVLVPVASDPSPSNIWSK